MRMNSELIMIDMLLLKPYSLKNVYYSVLHSLPYDPRCQSTFPEVSSLSTICSYETCSITAAIVNASRELFLFFTFVLPVTWHTTGTQSVLK